MTQGKSASTPAVRWAKLCEHLNHWYYSPDLQALEVALCAGMAHYSVESDPVWLFVIGPSSSGKTSIIINALAALPNTHLMGDITPLTFISHFKKGSEANPAGLLHKLGSSATLLFKDFTTIMSKREDDKGIIASQFREIYDGAWTRHTGVDGQPLWKGKITAIAATTPAFEKAWTIRRELGERFVQVRWPWNGSIEMAYRAAAQRGKESGIVARTKELTLDFCCGGSKITPPPPLEGEWKARTGGLAFLVARLRGGVTRDAYNGRREIIDDPIREEPGRVAKSLETIVAIHAKLWDRLPTMADFVLAKRVALDSIPVPRARFFQRMPAAMPISRQELLLLTGLSDSTFNWVAEDLIHLGIVRKIEDEVGGVRYALLPEVAEHREVAFADTP